MCEQVGDPGSKLDTTAESLSLARESTLLAARYIPSPATRGNSKSNLKPMLLESTGLGKCDGVGIGRTHQFPEVLGGAITRSIGNPRRVNFR